MYQKKEIYLLVISSIIFAKPFISRLTGGILGVDKLVCAYLLEPRSRAGPHESVNCNLKESKYSIVFKEEIIAIVVMSG